MRSFELCDHSCACVKRNGARIFLLVLVYSRSSNVMKHSWKASTLFLALGALCALGLAACVEAKPGTDRLTIAGDSGVAHADATVTDAGEPADAIDDIDGTIEEDLGIADTGEFDAGDVGIDVGTPGCVPTGNEICDNGLDDDCQNGIDCNDRACGACYAVPDPFAAGVVVDAMVRCPAGFEESETQIFSGLDPGPGCAVNCTCTTNPTECLGEIYIYATNAQCTGDTTLTGGQLYTAPIDTMCTTMPVQEGFPGGFRLGNWTVNQTCNSAGTASPSPYSWTQHSKLCVAQLGRMGCDAQSVCIPASNTEKACLMSAGGVGCPGPFADRMVQWYTGQTDTRSCAPCDCTAFGGSCQFAQIAFGSDWSCTDSYYVSTGSPQVCMSNYSPPARVTGNPMDPMCTPISPVEGELTATGQQTVCCLP